jgi:hypothetical protein
MRPGGAEGFRGEASMAKFIMGVLVASVVGCAGLGGAARAADPPIATAIGGDAPSDAPDSTTSGGATSAAAAEIDAIGPADNGPNVAYVVPLGSPPFTAMMPHDAALAGAFGILGGIAGAVSEMSEGHKIITENDVANPGVSIGKALATHMARDLHDGVVAIPVDPKKHSNSDLAAAGAAAQARYVVVANTLMWGILYYSLDWGHFHVNYMAAMDLIDTKSGEVIFKAKCNYHPPKEEAESRAALVANKAADLKARLQHAADHCAGEFEGKLPKL